MKRMLYVSALLVCSSLFFVGLNACESGPAPTENNQEQTKSDASPDSTPTDNAPTDNAPTDNAAPDAGPTDTAPTDNAPADNAPTDSAPPKSIVETASGNPDFSILVAAVTKAGLASALGGNDLTVFAPTNAAFASLLKDDLGLEVDANDPLKDLTKEQLIPILKYHVLGAKVDATAATTAATNNSMVDSLGGKIQLSLEGGQIKLDARATVVTPNIMASNGIIHVIDKVILPSTTEVLANNAKELKLETLLAAVGAADNGKDDKDKLTTLLDGQGTFTLFAPMDSGFATVLSENGIADLNALVGAIGGQDGLINLLKYHVAAATLNSKAVIAADGREVDVASGGKISVTVENGAVIVNKDVTAAVKGVNTSTVKVVDIYTANGVIHILDKVIAPKQ